MEREFKLTENAVKNLLSTYADHYLMRKEYEDCFGSEWEFHNVACHIAEDWMRAIGIHPDSNFVQKIIEKEKELIK
jgi:hypothetical protein